MSCMREPIRKARLSEELPTHHDRDVWAVQVVAEDRDALLSVCSGAKLVSLLQHKSVQLYLRRRARAHLLLDKGSKQIAGDRVVLAPEHSERAVSRRRRSGFAKGDRIVLRRVFLLGGLVMPSGRLVRRCRATRWRAGGAGGATAGTVRLGGSGRREGFAGRHDFVGERAADGRYWARGDEEHGEEDVDRRACELAVRANFSFGR